MEKEKRRAQVREANRAYRQKLRASGLKEIALWVTPEQEKAIKEIIKKK